MHLMLKDKEVLYFNLDEFVIVIRNNDLLPYGLRGVFRSNTNIKSVLHNIESLKTYLSSRVLSLSRDNAKQLLTLFKIKQSNDIETRVGICIKCRGVSVQDSYWIKYDTDKDLRWADINIRDKKLADIVDVALYGVHPSITVDIHSPELTTSGLFRKAWIREKDGLYLLKSDRTNNFINTKMEVLASKVLGCFEFNCNLDYVRYTGRYRNTTVGRLYVDKCKNFINEKVSLVDADAVISAIGRSGRKFNGYTPEIASITVIDFILANTDRHMENWGFLMDNETGKITGLAPLFDFNCALVSDYFNKDVSGTMSQMFNDGSTIIGLMEKHLPYSRVKLDINKWNGLYKKEKQWRYILDRVYKRVKYLGVV